MNTVPAGPPHLPVSDRLARWVHGAFYEQGAAVLHALKTLPVAALGGQDVERVQAALVLPAAGDVERFRDQLRLLQQDWRDLLVCAGLGDGDWRHRLAAALGPEQERPRP